MICPKCGNDNPNPGAACPSCGNITSNFDPNTMPSAPLVDNSIRNSLIGSIVIGVVAFFILGFLSIVGLSTAIRTRRRMINSTTTENVLSIIAIVVNIISMIGWILAIVLM